MHNQQEISSNSFIGNAYSRYLEKNFNQLQKPLSIINQAYLQYIKTNNFQHELNLAKNQRDYASTKLFQEQKLLIFHLQQKLKELQNFKVECQKLDFIIKQIEKKYIDLFKERKLNHQTVYLQLGQLQIEYQGLHLLLNQYSRQSVDKYQILLQLQERHSILRQKFKNVSSEFINIKTEHQIQKKINNQKGKENDDLKNLIQEQSKKKSQYTKQHQQQLQQSLQLQQRLSFLQQQIKNMQNQKQNKKQILKAAQKDNFVLKQSLKRHTEQQKLKQIHLEQLNSEKQNLKKQKQILNQSYQNVAHKYKKGKNDFVHQNAQHEKLSKRLQKLIFQDFSLKTEQQNIKISFTLQMQNKKQKFNFCQQKKQELQRNIYFLDQYYLVNLELMREIQILVRQDFNKNHHKRHHFLEQCLERCQPQMSSNRKIAAELKQSIISYHLI